MSDPAFGTLTLLAYFAEGLMTGHVAALHRRKYGTRWSVLWPFLLMVLNNLAYSLLTK